MAENFDYIVVGAGSAGCVLANRLSEDRDVRVMLVEAGGKDENFYIRVPAGFMDIVNVEEIQWRYVSEAEPALDNRRMWQQRGRVLGGSSSINAMMYMRGNPLDYQRWVDLGAKGWSHAEVLPYFRKSETYDGGADSYRGGEGPLGVHRATMASPLFEVFIEAGVEAGYPRNEDVNGARQEGFGPADSTVRNGRRSSTAEAYLHPVSGRPNLEIRTDTLAHRVVIEEGRARGVMLERGGTQREARAEREVILSAGAINSPHLLNYLACEEDREDMRAAFTLTREVHRQPAFDPYRGRELLPGDEVTSREEIDAFIRQTATTNFHVSGTCAMGAGAGAVVDSECRVYGIEGLRVADASVMPSIPSGNTNAPTIMIGEKVADLLRGRRETPSEADFPVDPHWRETQRPRPHARRERAE